MRIKLPTVVICTVLATWILIAIAPSGMRVCIQSDGLVQTGLSCPCGTCQEPAAEEPACAGSSCGCVDSAAVANERCCTCIELPTLTVIACVKLPVPNKLPAAVCQGIVLPQARFTALACVHCNFAQANPPPLLHSPVLRI